MGYKEYRFAVDSSWYSGEANIKSFLVEELLATKLRALYQRKKGRDLLDLWLVIERNEVDLEQTVFCFNKYLEKQNLTISKDQFEKNLDLKMQDSSFLTDTKPIVAVDFHWNYYDARDVVVEKIFPLLKQ